MVLKTENEMNEKKKIPNPCPYGVYAFVKGDRGEKVKYIVCYLVVSATEENNADKRDNACSHVYTSKSLMCILIRNLKVVRKWIWGNNKSLGQITAPWD